METNYVVCLEKKTGAITIRISSDANPRRFEVLNTFNTFEEALDYIGEKRKG